MSDDHVPAAVRDPKRLAAVRASGLLDTAPEVPFDRLTALAATLLDAPLAFATIVDEQRSFWKSCVGIAEGEERENRVEESFCQYVVGSGRELLVGDAASDPRTRDNPSVDAMGIRAWAGFPLNTPGGAVLGSFCVVDTKPRKWTARDVEVLATLAGAASSEIALRAAATRAQTLAHLAGVAAPAAPARGAGASNRGPLEAGGRRGSGSRRFLRRLSVGRSLLERGHG